MAADPTFRQRLDAVLRTLDVAQVRGFLVDAGQWTTEKPADPEAAMWMMIAASPALRSLHGQAGRWLAEHGRVEDAQAILGNRSEPSQSHRPPQHHQHRGPPRPGGQRDSQRDRQHDSQGRRGGSRPPRRRP